MSMLFWKNSCIQQEANSNPNVTCLYKMLSFTILVGADVPFKVIKIEILRNNRKIVES
jgi:hypothetical protein